jgi:nucleoside-diphosphate-sugar epimerase
MQTIGLIGVGRIGTEIAKLLLSGGYRVLGYRRSSLHAAFEQMRDRGKVEIIWGPLRHGAGHNIVFYFRDFTGNLVEFSAEEEIILNDATYVPRAWPVTDPRAGDEWNLSPIPAAMM